LEPKNINGQEDRIDRHEMPLLFLCSSVCFFFNPTIFVGGVMAWMSGLVRSNKNDY